MGLVERKGRREIIYRVEEILFTLQLFIHIPYLCAAHTAVYKHITFLRAAHAALHTNIVILSAAHETLRTQIIFLRAAHAALHTHILFLRAAHAAVLTTLRPGGASLLTDMIFSRNCCQ